MGGREPGSSSAPLPPALPSHLRNRAHPSLSRLSFLISKWGLNTRPRRSLVLQLYIIFFSYLFQNLFFYYFYKVKDSTEVFDILFLKKKHLSQLD